MRTRVTIVALIVFLLTLATTPAHASEDVRQDIQDVRRAMAVCLIVGQMATGSVEEDWTYWGAPFVVGEWNDTLQDEYNDQADEGIQDAEMWLLSECTAIGWLDNSPVFADGSFLRVDDSTSPPTVAWYVLTDKYRPYITSTPTGL